MRNSQNITLTTTDAFATDDETTWSLPGAVVGFASWLLALGIPFLVYGPNTLFFFMPVAVVVGIALHSLLNGKLRYSIVATLLTVCAMFGALFMWLLG